MGLPRRSNAMTTSAARRARLLFAAAVACGVFAQAAPAAAQSQDEAAARALFMEGRKLVKAGRLADACERFQAARHLFASPGVLLNLADCHERINRTASAWTEFGDAADAAARENRPADQAEAQKRQAALQDKLSLLAVRVTGPSSDEAVERDGAPVDRATWNTAIPVDPGSHVIAAKASGRRPWSTTVEVTEPGKTVTVEVPALEETAGPAQVGTSASPGIPGNTANPSAAASSSDSSLPHTPAESGTPDPGRGQRIAGWAVGGVGVAAMATSGVLALVAKSQFNTAERESGSARHTDSVHAGQLADVATVVLIAGGVATAAGIVVWLTAPKASVAVGTNGSMVFLRGTF
jgi:hypothetical protein